jgi:DNA polymerase III subunit alpha
MFVHLHNHSEYSILDGAIKVYEMASKARKLGMPAIALTDHGVMYGAIDFYKACRKYDVKPIMGVEVYIAPEGMEKRQPGTGSNYHMILLAENNTGYENLMHLVSESHTRGFYYKPRLDYETLAKYSDGLLATTACISGEVSRKLINGDDKGAEKALQTYMDIFPGRLWIELQDHGIKQEILVNPKLVELSKKYNIPVIAAQDAHYLDAEDADSHDTLLCIQTLSKKDDPNRMRFTGQEFYLKTSEQMAKLFDWIPEAITNTLVIAERCNVEIELGVPHPPRFKDIESNDPAVHKQFLEDLVQEGARKRFKGEITHEIVDRIKYEMEIIEQTGFIDYFLVVWDFIKYAREQGIPVGPGRGSGAASLVSYCLNITDLNPLEYGLFFERFLNPERVSPPDFDIDFDDTRRDEVIQYVTRKYGEDTVAQVATFGRMEARAVLRDVGRALDFSYAEMDKIAKAVPFGSDLDEAIETVPMLAELAGLETHKQLFKTARRLQGIVRNFSTHAAGVVMADKPLSCYVPVQLDKEGKRVTQYEKNAIEELGILKVDFLGLRTLSVIDRACRIIESNRGEKIDIDNLPLDDEETYKTLQEADTTGVFQLESSGMRRYLRELKPTVLSDIIAMVALFRPGPMEWIPKFISGKQGITTPTYLDPSLKPILEGTYGVAVYQEQILQIARDFAGFSLGQADLLRKAVGKKIPELLAEQKKNFIKKAVEIGKSKSIAEEVFKFIEPFAGYGFNRAHASCYGLIAYQTAYLKTHYKLEFFTSIFTSQLGNEDRISHMYRECKRAGIEVLPPDINKSQVEFTIEGESIRFGLGALKNVGSTAVSVVLEARKKCGGFKDFSDYQHQFSNTTVNKKVTESLIKAGAFDTLDDDRSILLENMGNVSEGPGLFAGFQSQAPTKTSKEEILEMEKEILGFYMSDHPLRPYESIIKRERHTDILDLAEVEEDTNVRIIGIITNAKRKKSKKGSMIARFTLEDLTGSCPVIAFGKAYDPIEKYLDGENIIVLEGRLEKQEGTPKIIASSVIRRITAEELQIEKSSKPPIVCISIKMETQGHLLSDLKTIIDSNEGDSPVEITLSKSGKKVLLETEVPIKINSSSKVLGKIRDIVGTYQVELKQDSSL